ncbi:MAG: F0F1 ATP synthase subunit alpha [Oscillospiraceae bacterium]|nr:F0F1 ATP synthase subunit alpha [Eubacteriales bacterium]MDY2618708.1 F0F1 ATP synthase subunit alpha [Oscillospiraceae bacterium]
MSKSAKDYAEQCLGLHIPMTALTDTVSIFHDVPVLREQLSDPTLPMDHKMDIIDRIIPLDARDLLKLMCVEDQLDLLEEVNDLYHALSQKRVGDLYVTLRYVTAPTEEQLDGIKQFVAHRYGEEGVVFEMEEDPTLVSGFKLTAGNEEYDWSAKGRLAQLQQRLSTVKTASEKGIISILKAEIEDFDLNAEFQEIGTVQSVGDGIARIDGIDHAAYGEIVIFDSGVKGMVQDVRTDSTGVILFGSDVEIKEGSRVVRTGKRAGIGVGDAMLGRVVDALGAPIDGKGEIKADDYRPIEHKAPGVITRKEVNQPLQTGILAIDSMFPIGRGQRELIIGDRQTGKTALAVDTILNQKGNGVICIYVAIGQKASTVAQIVNTLKTHGAMDYSIVVSATASDPATLQYIAPYSGAAIGEHFMDEGKDVLIIYDDLSKHAQAYRAISLLLKRPPGREAYPGDVFYLHSRLLERACRRDEKYGGGSMTALPIIETQAGDVSAYIPTNVISITDGQIFLESDLFHSGQRPAVNVGLSVSRVGGKAQTKAMKTVAGTLRIDLSQYREMESFTQFSSDLDEATRNMLDYGRSLYQLLKQPLYHPMSVAKQVILLCAANEKLLVDVGADKMEAFKDDLMTFMETEHPEIVSEITDTGKISDELKEQVLSAVRQFKSR